MELTKIAITRPIFIFMLMIGALLAGYMSFTSMRQEQNPDVQFGVITVRTIYPGAGPEEVNALLSRKIEESLSGINGLLEVTSSSQEGISVVVASFEVGTNMDAALNDTRAKVDSLVGELPREIEKPVVSKVDSASEPVLDMTISSKSLSALQLRDLADETLKDRFARIKGVGEVSVSGGEEREIRVHLKKDRLISYGIGINQVQQALMGTTMNVPSGRIVGKDQEFAVRVKGEFQSIEEIGNTSIRISDAMNPDKASSIRLSDIAEIKDSAVEKRSLTRVNGQETVLLSIQKAKEGNAIEISTAAKAAISKIEAEYDVKFTIVDDTSKVVKESLTDLFFALIFGVILVCLIVYMFLHNFRGMLIVAVAIPICLMATLLVLRVLGFTINNMSMLALSLAIGVLVDDAIVVLENIYRHLSLGEDPKSAAINGRGEIGLAAIAITLADIVVFLPMGFMGGIVGQFFRPLGIAFAVAVFLSLMVSFTVTPMLAARWYREGENVEHFDKGFAGWFERRFSALAERYRTALAWALNHRWFVFIAGFVVLIGVFQAIGGSMAPTLSAAMTSSFQAMLVPVAVIAVLAVVCNFIFYARFVPRIIWGAALFLCTFPLFAGIGFFYGQWKQSPLFAFTFFPPSDQGRISVNIETAPGTSLDRTMTIISGIETTIQAHPDVEFVKTNVGTWSAAFGGSGGSRGTNLASMDVTLREKQSIMDQLAFWVKHDEKLRTRADTSITADLIERVGKVSGARVTISVLSGFGGSPIQMSFASEDRELLNQTVQKIAARLSGGAVPGVINVDISSKPGKPEFRMIPDRARASDANVTTQEIATAMRMMYEGDDTVKYRVRGVEYPIRVMLDPADRNNPDLVDTVPIKFWQGRPIFLPQVSRIESGVTVDKIDRRNRQEEVRISTDLLPGFVAGSTQAKIDELIKNENLIPEGVAIKPLGQADVQSREMQYLMTTLLLGFLLVYMVLASLYNNLLYPFIIQLAQPQAFVGALLALILTDKTLNIVGFIGLIALVGLVGKNAILLVDYTNTLRARGRDRHEALLEAGPTRLRPITMTTLAIVLGTLPVAMAIGRGSEFRETMGIIIIGGILLSTALTLLVIPCSYTIFDDLAQMFERFRNRRKLTPDVSQIEDSVHRV